MHILLADQYLTYDSVSFSDTKSSLVQIRVAVRGDLSGSCLVKMSLSKSGSVC